MENLDRDKTKCAKGILALFIVLHHVSYVTTSECLTEFVYWGNVVCGCFFFLSGYGLMKSLKVKGDLYLNNFLFCHFIKLFLPLILVAFVFALLYNILPSRIEYNILQDLFSGKTFVPNTWFVFDLVKGSWPTEVFWDFMGGFFQHGHLWMFWYFGAMIVIYLLLPRFQKVMFGKKVLLGLFSMVSVTFCFNLLWGFEERFVNQTLRLWNWLFYFGIGGYLCKNSSPSNKVKSKYVSLMEIFGASSLFVLFSYILYDKLSGIEYYFGSLFCIIYAICLFVYVIQLPIKGNKLISVLANLFLPVYALHWEVKIMLSFVDTTLYGMFSPLVDFVILSMVTLLVSWLLMRIPVIKKIFNI